MSQLNVARAEAFICCRGLNMPTNLSNNNSRERMWLPFMAGFYDGVAQPLAWVGLRVLTGGLLVISGWPKIIAPMGMIPFVESLHFYPGWFWSPFLAAIQFFGGLAIVAGLLTRPMALANAVMLAITLYFHFTHPYGDRFLTDAGVEFMKGDGANISLPPRCKISSMVAVDFSVAFRRRPFGYRCFGRQLQLFLRHSVAAHGRSTNSS